MDEDRLKFITNDIRLGTIGKHVADYNSKEREVALVLQNQKIIELLEKLNGNCE